MKTRLICVVMLCGLMLPAVARAQSEREPMPRLSEMSSLVQRIDQESTDTLATPIKILLLVTLLSLVPAMLMLTTAFTRIVIVLGFIRRALTTRNIPPNQVIVGLALFLSLFVMAPTMGEINSAALQPYLQGSIGAQQAIDEGIVPLRKFMFNQTGDSELSLFLGMAGVGEVETRDDVPTHVLVPSFVISELKRAFELGFLLYLPFLVVDLVVASVLLSMGMIMLPPVMISAPLKILLFVLVDGWRLIAESLVISFGGA
ncbi:MAG: flagellar type III secretion system pore protein FliP [Candidatus Brocadiia bacterium]